MSYSDAEIMKYIKNEAFVEYMKIQLNLTLYETLALLAIIFGHNTPTSIAQGAKVPRSKIYSTLELLEKKGMIIRTENANIKINQNILSRINEEFRQDILSYDDFLKNIKNYAYGSRVPEKIKEITLNILNNYNYLVEYPDKVLTEDHRKRLLEMFSEYSNRERDFSPRSRGRLPPRQMRLDSDSEGKEIITFIDYYGESTTSGIRIGFLIMDEMKSSLGLDIISSIINTVSTFFDFQHLIIYYTTGISRRTMDELKDNAHSLVYYRELDRYYINPMDDIEIKTEQIINNIEDTWLTLKEHIVNLERQIDKVRDQIRLGLNNLDYLRYGSNNYDMDYRNTYEDIFSRYKKDLNNYENLIAEHRENISRLYERLQRKRLFDDERLDDIENSVNEIELSVSDKVKLVNNLRIELMQFPTGDHPYLQYGYDVNPFQLIVPMPNPERIINETAQQEQLNSFLSSYCSGSDNNLLLISAKEGMGKTHFLNYYQHKINQEEYGKNIALKIQCRPNRDCIDVYPQITNELLNVIKDKNDVELERLVSTIIIESGTPRIIADMMEILRKIAIQISINNYNKMFILIDEFENTFTNVYSRRHDFEDGINRRTPSSIIQLDLLTKLSSIGFILNIRNEDWINWQDNIRNRLSKLKNECIVILDRFSLPDTSIFVNHRLNSKLFRKKDSEYNPPVMSEEVIQYIFKQSEGVPRDILITAEKIFRDAVTNRLQNITLDSVERE